MMWFWAGLALGLLLHRQGNKPLLRFPLRCWFFGHVIEPEPAFECPRCHRYHGGYKAKALADYYWGARFESTFWTT